MANLLKFLNKDKQAWEDHVVISKRLTNETGAPMKFHIKSMTLEQYNSYREQASTMDIKRKTASFSTARYQELVIINHTLDPSFKDAAILKEAGMPSPEHFLQATLKAGEAETLMKKILELSGFDNNMDDLVIEAKNS